MSRFPLPLFPTIPILACSLLGVTGMAPPSFAHNVEVSEDVAATMHIEPNHNPRAGEPSLTWFALTREGGTLLPLDQCHCQLNVYGKPDRPGNAPLLQPPLRAIAAEGYRNIPGTEITFPRAGQYILELNGRPKETADPFQPFSFRYTVTVTGGRTETSANTASPTTAPTPTQANQPVADANPGTNPRQLLMFGFGMVFGLGLATMVWKRQRKP